MKRVRHDLNFGFDHNYTSENTPLTNNSKNVLILLVLRQEIYFLCFSTLRRELLRSLRFVACELFFSNCFKSIARNASLRSQYVLRSVFTPKINLAVRHEAEAIHHNRFLG
jgi:hypothetical protein